MWRINGNQYQRWRKKEKNRDKNNAMLKPRAKHAIFRSIRLLCKSYQVTSFVLGVICLSLWPSHVYWFSAYDKFQKPTDPLLHTNNICAVPFVYLQINTQKKNEEEKHSAGKSNGEIEITTVLNTFLISSLPSLEGATPAITFVASFLLRSRTKFSCGWRFSPWDTQHSQREQKETAPFVANLSGYFSVMPPDWRCHYSAI